MLVISSLQPDAIDGEFYWIHSNDNYVVIDLNTNKRKVVRGKTILSNIKKDCIKYINVSSMGRFQHNSYLCPIAVLSLGAVSINTSALDVEYNGNDTVQYLRVNDFVIPIVKNQSVVYFGARSLVLFDTAILISKIRLTDIEVTSHHISTRISLSLLDTSFGKSNSLELGVLYLSSDSCYLDYLSNGSSVKTKTHLTTYSSVEFTKKVLMGVALL